MSLFDVTVTTGRPSGAGAAATGADAGGSQSAAAARAAGMAGGILAADMFRLPVPRRGAGVGAFLLAVCTAGALAHVGVRLKGLEVAYDLGRERRIATELEEQRRRLQIEIGMLKDPRRVIAIARDKLSMGPPAPEAIWRLGSARIFGAVARQAAGAVGAAGVGARAATDAREKGAPLARAAGAFREEGGEPHPRPPRAVRITGRSKNGQAAPARPGPGSAPGDGEGEAAGE